MFRPQDAVLTWHLPCPPEAACRCRTKPALLKQVFAPAPGHTVEVVIDLHPGGRLSGLMQVEAHRDIGSEGCDRAAYSPPEPGRRLTLTVALAADWRPNPPASFSAGLCLDPAAGGGYGCRMSARHAGAETAARHAGTRVEPGRGQVAISLANARQSCNFARPTACYLRKGEGVSGFRRRSVLDKPGGDALC